MRSRGALIVFEGADRCGKSTQSVKLLEYLLRIGKKAELIKFPERTTEIGTLIDAYLTNKENPQLDNNVIHLLFSANRWEAKPRMKKLLSEGVTLIVDRYSYSGVAYSAAKQASLFDWAVSTEKGLFKPDLVLYLKSKMAAFRPGFGEERFETEEFQKRVELTYQSLFDPTWKIINADQEIDEVTDSILPHINACLSDIKDNTLQELWVKDAPTFLCN